MSYVSREEQRALRIPYPSVGTVSRKCYFTEGNAKNGIKHLPKFLREQVEIVKYVPENFQKEKYHYLKINKNLMTSVKQVGK